MIGRLFFWGFIAFIAMLCMSKITLETSIYVKDQNSLEIIFPQWKADKPWIYFYWEPGYTTWTPDTPAEENSDGLNDTTTR